ncbi:glycoside hydrolase superfamily [Chaetomium sp. MPI-CAGE-AT-0009]|nr:glycoside hydrolase superfamily [Chaetomium sp. MPI-CAGE-AT-0009]
MIHSGTLLFISLLAIFSVILPVAAQECSATNKCATGCCSQFGFCGTSEEHCGEGCLSTCDFRLGCDAQNPCADGTCCSKFGFCGFGKDYCSPEVCVAGCDAKSQCDPGTFGADYVELQKCPLNVCCSKWGYCGATAEFCAGKKVKRPSCPVDNTKPMRRVVGYYEGWAARRSCHAFMPEDVPAGVYTHLNFAFVSIDPVSFEVVPAQAEDIRLYSRLTDLKKRDSALKVYIAIGGWTFNDPGATFHTFSQLAADEAKQKLFFASLISFMNTYDFDGVDLDWEYPVDTERRGNVADYANFPRFLQNLRAALDTGSGGRNRLTLTLPVDFFNVISYDLHGLWDKGNKWLGAFLNSHTNITEITEYLDLFWRNDINPEKVVLGLAFYSRTFVAADPGCTEAQCLFDGVGEAGPCSKDEIGGTLTNAELTDEIRAAGVTPTLDEEAMVKVAVVGRKWITYDDEDTFKLKSDAARKLCLGGVMVWAVSQDYTEKELAAVAAAAAGGSGEQKRDDTVVYNTRYSKQLQRATNYQSPNTINTSFITFPIFEPSPNIVRNQCFWSNCGAGCGSGYLPVPRLDTDASHNELMQYGAQCHGGRLRHFCCPWGKTMPKCGWFDFYNGKCGNHGACPAGSEEIVGPAWRQREVGSTQTACNNGKAQVACCETKQYAVPRGSPSCLPVSPSPSFV